MGFALSPPVHLQILKRPLSFLSQRVSLTDVKLYIYIVGFI